MIALGRLAYQKAATLIIMGITEKDELRQIFLGSNTVKMAEQNICPVMNHSSKCKIRRHKEHSAYLRL
ncbi:MAG: universal stress protein [Bacteroidota bacterium]